MLFDEWLKLPEPSFFNSAGKIDPNWLLACYEKGLEHFINRVDLLRVNGKLFKLTGSERKLFWGVHGKFKPEYLVARIFDLSENHLDGLQKSFLAKKQRVLPSPEAIKQFYRELNLSFNSDRIGKGHISEMLYLALRGKQRYRQEKKASLELEDIDIKKAIGLLAPELLIVDALNPKKDIFYTGVLAATLIILSIRNPNTHIIEFLTKLNQEDGGSLDDRSDPVDALLKAIYIHRLNGATSTPSITIALCQKTIEALTLWESGQDSPGFWRKKILKGIDHLPFVKQLRKIKAIDNVTDL